PRDHGLGLRRERAPPARGVRGCAAFFFQAEDGIRDFHVTGVQTCALPISYRALSPEARVHPSPTCTTNMPSTAKPRATSMPTRRSPPDPRRPRAGEGEPFAAAAGGSPPPARSAARPAEPSAEGSGSGTGRSASTAVSPGPSEELGMFGTLRASPAEAVIA